MSHVRHPVVRAIAWRASLAAFALLAAGSSLEAGVITYVETLEDLNNPLVYLENFVPTNLDRTRSLGDGSPPQHQGIDLIIQNQNDVSHLFGQWTSDPVTYSHVFIPVGPISSFDTLRLTITAASVNTEPDSVLPDLIEILLGTGQDDDPVHGDGVFLGFLPSSPFLGQSTFQFETGNAILIGLLLANNRLDITVTPTGPGVLGEQEHDRIAVRSSTLQATYAVPEPGTLSLLALSLLAAGIVRQTRLR
jgi:hypothetical protein